MTTTTAGVLTREEALDRMPLLTANKLRELTREGKGPKFSRVGTVLIFRETDINDWYPKYVDSLFSTKDTLTRKTSKAVAMKAKNGTKI